MTLRIRTKRVYETPAASDGKRVLVERLWPRGLSKERARVDRWSRELAPSPELRRWFDHDPDRWESFRERYFAELDELPDEVAALLAVLGRGPVTFVFASREERFNNSVALAEYLERAARRAGS